MTELADVRVDAAVEVLRGRLESARGAIQYDLSRLQEHRQSVVVLEEHLASERLAVEETLAALAALGAEA